jgi:hypothetical protein
MARNLFLGSLIVCLLCVALVQVDDLGVFGITEEPDTILYYGGLGMLAGLTGVTALGSGLYWYLSGRSKLSPAARRRVRIALLVILAAMLVSLLVRIVPVIAAA